MNGQIRDVLPELVNGTLPAGEIARVQDHVRACADCAAEVELLRTARAAMRLAPPTDTTRIAAAVQASTAERLAARRVPARVARIASVTLILAVGAIGIWSMRDSAPAATEPRVAAFDAAIDAADAPATIEQARVVTQPRAARAPVQLALGGDMSQLEDDQLVALMQEVSALEAMPGAEPASLAIEPVVPESLEDL
ncbi:MAG: anti-sigma factor family protein [Gemmatimonadaceae bacterium]